MWESFDCYGVLGCDPGCSPQDLKAAYRAASLQSHPDRGGSHDAQVRVNTAYEVLSDPVSRVAHDVHWKVLRKPRPGNGAGKARANDERSRAASRPGQSVAPSIVVEPLSGLRARVEEVQARRATIFADLGNRIERDCVRYRRERSSQRKTLVWSLAAALASGVVGVHFRLLWLGTAASILSFVGHLAGPRLNGRTWSPFRIGRGWVEQEARAAAEKACSGEAASFERYTSKLAEMADLLLRESTFADTEAHVARRICTALFLLGYRPVQYLAQDRILVFTDGVETTLVRFRHRSGAPTNVTYVERLVAAMRATRTTRGYLFCSPGLSGNAERLARKSGIRSYTLEEMHEWVHQTLAADYSGPAGDILEHVDELAELVRRLAGALPAASTGTSRPRRRRRWGPW